VSDEAEIMMQIAERAAPVVYELMRARGDLLAWAEPWEKCDADMQATWIAEEQDIVGPALDAILESDWLAARIREAKAEAWDEACEAFAWCLNNGELEDSLPYMVEHNPYRSGTTTEGTSTAC
jgi:hypothetical protein